MTGLIICNNEICIKDIEPGQLGRLLKWYNKTDEYSFATGFDMPVTLVELAKKYFEILYSKEDLFLGIHETTDDNMIGMLKCRLSDGVLWIYAILIDKAYQDMGYGTKTISLLLSYLNSHRNVEEAFISVAAENNKGKLFWLRCGFKELMTSEGAAVLNGKETEVIIMKRQL